MKQTSLVFALCLACFSNVFMSQAVNATPLNQSSLAQSSLAQSSLDQSSNPYAPKSSSSLDLNPSDGVSQFELAIKYDKGEGVPQDGEKAKYWYEKAASNGVADAAYSMGYLYAMGEYVQKDPAKAIEWFKKAAMGGSSEAQFALALAYQKGLSIEKDESLAASWYEKSAEQGNPRAQYNLGLIYDKGIGVKQDQQYAMELYAKAAAQGDPRAQEILDQRQNPTPNEVRENSIEGLEKSANSGDVESMILLGQKYSDGDGLPKNRTLAVHWYAAATNKGSVIGELNLGGLLFEASTIPGNPLRIAGYALLSLAAQEEGPQKYTASHNKGLAEQSMSPEEIQKGQALMLRIREVGVDAALNEL